ncbi:hypothetical protein D9758_012474 [Tetrapyrgos nigripes]|uniref:Uncharacterized protein n=1 Tax=Tetrapyrgos nigripes TaxID=182062 RepID=A0A8H5CYN2_9AGAR|nr:hypothetical protein D9758_012474 [Tetrapyrgos nigripes]
MDYAKVTTCMSFSIRTRDWRIDGRLAESPKFIRSGSGTFNFLDGTASAGVRRRRIAYFS